MEAVLKFVRGDLRGQSAGIYEEGAIITVEVLNKKEKWFVTGKMLFHVSSITNQLPKEIPMKDR